MAFPRLKWPKKTLSTIATIAAFLSFAYVGSALVVLDFTESAYPPDEEYFGDRQVSFGPRPRFCFCTPSEYDIPGGASYDGSEWALIVYRPICQGWVAIRGYAPPFVWR